jgi:hypothetical protein
VNAPTTADLTDIQRALLAVLGSGIAPSSVANDERFRLDYLTAVTLALLRGEPRDIYAGENCVATADFQRQLADAMYDLADRRVLAVGAAPAMPVLSPDGESSPLADRTAPVSYDQHPTVFDRYLAGRCLDEVLRHPDAYRFLMDMYADSSEVWQRVYKQYT